MTGGSPLSCFDIFSLVMLVDGNLITDASDCGGMMSLWLADYDKVGLMLRKLIG